MEPDPPALQPIDPLLLQHFVLPMLSQLQLWRGEAARGSRRLPLIGLNGPVGAGKTSLGRQLEAMARHVGLRLVVASIDDVYLRWPERGERLAGNPFGVSRVPPGSHDLPLLLASLEHWRQTGILRLPRFDKTLAAGQGDRAGWRHQECDALVLEGWLMGCQPLSDSDLSAALKDIPAPADQREEEMDPPHPAGWWGRGAPSLQAEEWRWLTRWNQELKHYQPLWGACDGLWLLRPMQWNLPRRWRFQAEARQRRAGGGWLPGDELERLVRASLCSLPPALYQDPLVRELAGEAIRFGSADAGPCPAGWPRPVLGQGIDREEGGDCPSSWQSAMAPDERSEKQARSTEWPTGLVAESRTETTDESLLARQALERSKRPPVQAVAWLDGRRRCRSVWVQPSLSSASSATG